MPAKLLSYMKKKRIDGHGDKQSNMEARTRLSMLNIQYLELTSQCK